MKTIEKYRTSDGKLFDHESQAINHQSDLYCELLDALSVRYNGTETDRQKQLLKLIINNDLRLLISTLHECIVYMDENEITHDDIVESVMTFVKRSQINLG